MSKLCFFTNPWASGEIRGRQIAAVVGGVIDPRSVNHDDICIFVKHFPTDEFLDGIAAAYIDVVDCYGCIPWLRSHPTANAIAISHLGGKYLANVLGRDVSVIVEHHCNFERIQKPLREPQVVGYVGELDVFHLDIPRLKENVKLLGLEFIYLNEFKTRDDVCNFYQKIDIQLTFRQDVDNYGVTTGMLKNPLKLANAGSFGIPTVGYPEVTFVDEWSGRFIPAKSVDEVIYWLDSLKRDSALYASVSGLAFTRAEDYHIDNVAPLYRELFEGNQALSVSAELLREGRGKAEDVCAVYDTLLPLDRSASINILEIGVECGGSMRAWCNIYPNANVFGVDCEPKCMKVDVGRAKIFIGKQEDKEFLATLVEQLPMLDIIIDDGGHYAPEQQESFNALFGKVKPGGIYVVEDLQVAQYRAIDGYPCTIDFIKALPHKHRFIRRGETTIMAFIRKAE